MLRMYSKINENYTKDITRLENLGYEIVKTLNLGTSLMIKFNKKNKDV